MGNINNIGPSTAKTKAHLERESFKSLFEEHWEPMAAYASSIMDNDQTAQDLLQDVWMDYWKRRNDVEVQNLKAYLYSALRNKCYKFLRDNKLTQLQEQVLESELEIVDDGPSMEETNNRLHALQRSLASLPNRCREIFLLSRINGLSNTEIAKNLGISKKTVENQISSALYKLRKDLKDMSAVFTFFF